MFKSSLVFGLIVLITLMFAGCSKPKEEKEPVFLMKTPVMMIPSFEFSEELDLKRAAYPYNIDEYPAEYNEMVIHLVKILSEEIILLSAAAVKGIVVTQKDLEIAEAEFKKDYPDNSFDQMLLENAIPYVFWKKRFKRNMIMEKLVEQELSGTIEITSQDLVAFYNELGAGKDKISGDTEESVNIVENETELVSRLRLQKTQEKYEVWIQILRDQYPVEINNDELKTFLIALENNRGTENATKN
jgi:hypothetical protein